MQIESVVSVLVDEYVDWRTQATIIEATRTALSQLINYF